MPCASQVWWPEDVVDGEQGGTYYLVGWRTRTFTICVAAVIPGELKDVEHALRAVGADVRVGERRVPQLLGEYLVGSSQEAVRPSARLATRSSVWLRVTRDRATRRPVVSSLHDCGRSISGDATIILYTTRSKARTAPHCDGIGVLWPPWTSHASPPTSSELRGEDEGRLRSCTDPEFLRFARAVGQEVQRQVQEVRASPGASPPLRPGPSPSQESYPIARYVLGRHLESCRWSRPRPLASSPLSLLQTNLRWKWGKLLDLWQAWAMTARSRPVLDAARVELVAGTVVMHVCVDSLAGVGVGLLLRMYATSGSLALSGGQGLLGLDGRLRSSVEWLNTHPWGFKLNLPLTSRLCSVVIMLLDAHAATCARLFVLPGGMQCRLLGLLAAVGGLGGVTSLTAAAFDLLRVMTVHLSVLHAVFGRLYHVEVSLLGSAGRLFRGKKWNVLRRRTDSCEYSTQQLLLGIMLFTILTCLFQTIAVFHVFFWCVYGVVLGAQATVWVAYMLLRDLPSWPLMLLWTDPGFLIAGTQYELLGATSRQPQLRSLEASDLNVGSVPDGVECPSEGIEHCDEPYNSAGESHMQRGPSHGTHEWRSNTYFVLRSRPVSMCSVLWRYWRTLYMLRKRCSAKRVVFLVLRGAPAADIDSFGKALTDIAHRSGDEPDSSE